MCVYIYIYTYVHIHIYISNKEMLNFFSSFMSILSKRANVCKFTNI